MMSEFEIERNKILIVDDTPENIDILGEILSEYKKFIATTGERALKIAKEKLPDLILLDIMMPEMDGFEVCRRLKSDNDTKDIPVIFITAKNQVDDEVKGLEIGAVDFISKPISPPVVQARVKSHLELKLSREVLELRNYELSSALTELRETQNQLIHSEKMAALGQLVAGIAHEINTPLGAINSSNNSIFKELNFLLYEAPQLYRDFDDELMAVFVELLKKSAEKEYYLSSREERKHRKHLQNLLELRKLENADNIEEIADILVSLGVYDDIEPFMKIIESPKSEEILQVANKLIGIRFSNRIIATAIERVSKIVFSLKNFARFDLEGKKVMGNINENIDTVLTLYQNQFKHGVDLIKEFELEKLLDFVPDQLIQVWTNLIHNALQAMDHKGTLTIKTEMANDFAKISITDTGKGIPQDIIYKIFDPFFTTKASGEGTGLGLDIVKKIIKNHNGRIDVKSEVGVGSTFIIYLPIL